jgi:hypothetical protein
VSDLERAASILRGAEPGPMAAMRALWCLQFQEEAAAEWLENHPGDPRAVDAARRICQQEDELLDMYLRRAEEA